MAGFYEGEGSVSNDISNSNRLRVSVSQNDVTPLLKAQAIWGGSIRKKERISLKGKLCYGNEWRLSHKESLKFLDDINPYLQIPYKINQIEKALEIFKTPFTRRFKCHFCETDYASPSGRRRHEKNAHEIPDTSEDSLSNESSRDIQIAGKPLELSIPPISGNRHGDPS